MRVRMRRNASVRRAATDVSRGNGYLHQRKCKWSHGEATTKNQGKKDDERERERVCVFVFVCRGEKNRCGADWKKKRGLCVQLQQSKELDAEPRGVHGVVRVLIIQ